MRIREKAIIQIKNNRKLAEENYREQLDFLRSQDENFDALFRKVNSLKWDYIKARNAEQRATLELEIAQSELALNSVVAEKGLPFTAFELPYSCDRCNDTGVADGKICSCAERERVNMCLAASPVLVGYPSDFDHVDFAYYGDNSEEKRGCAKYITSAINAGRKIFVFAGKTGTGKTYFAGTAAKSLLLSGKDVNVVTAIKLNKALLEYHCAPLDKKGELWTNITESDVMVIDDLGAEQILNNVTVPYLTELLTERAENKITIITTNLSPIELEKRYGQRVVSRLFDKKLSIAIKFGGPDLRLSLK